MKTLFRLALALVVACMALAGPARADGPSGWERIQQDLSLTADQMKQVKPVMESYRKVKRERIEALSAQIREILSPAQRARFDALKAEHGQARSESGKGHGFNEFITSLSLSPDQIASLQKLVRDSMQQGRADYERFLDQIKPLLSADQFARFQEMTRRH